MIRIDSRSPVTSTGSTTGARRSTGAGFSLPTASAGTEARTAGVASAGSLDGLLALQAEEDTQERRRRQALRGHDLLDGLDRLKAALLAGRVPLGELERLKTLLAARAATSGDPQLDEVLGHIELRLAVELAKLGR